MTKSFQSCPGATLLSTKGLFLPGAGRFTAFARQFSGAHLDLDLTNGSPFAGMHLAAIQRDFAPRVATVWTPYPVGPRADILFDLLRQRDEESCLPLVVIDGPRQFPVPGSAARQLSQLHDQFRQHGAPVAIAIALHAHRLDGGRQHLSQLSGLRRLLEEWDLHIALDLDGPINIQWEAEAATARLGDRLALIRASSRAPMLGQSGEHRLERRTLRAALDLRQSIRVALYPETAWWERLSSRALTDAWLSGARELSRLAPHRFDDYWILPDPLDQRRHESTPPA